MDTILSCDHRLYKTNGTEIYLLETSGPHGTFQKVVNEVQDLGTDYFFLGSQPFSQREGSLQGVPLLSAMSLTIFSHHDFSFQISYDGTHNQN